MSQSILYSFHCIFFAFDIRQVAMKYKSVIISESTFMIDYSLLNNQISYYKTLNFRGVEDINMDSLNKNAFDVLANLDFVYVVIMI